MTEDYRPVCYICNKPMNKKDRAHAKEKQMPNLCIQCDTHLTKEIKRCLYA